MESHFFVSILIVLFINTITCFPIYTKKISERAINKLPSSTAPKVTVDAVLAKIILPTDTEFQKEAKKLIAQYLIALAAEANVTSTSNKLSKASERNRAATLIDEDKIRETIEAALFAAQSEELHKVGGLRGSRQLLTTQTPYVTKPTNSIQKHQTEVLSQVNGLVQSVQMGNVTGVVDTGLRIASLETIGVVVNSLLNIVLCNPLDRVRGTCSDTV